MLYISGMAGKKFKMSMKQVYIQKKESSCEGWQFIMLVRNHSNKKLNMDVVVMYSLKSLEA